MLALSLFIFFVLHSILFYVVTTLIEYMPRPRKWMHSQGIIAIIHECSGIPNIASFCVSQPGRKILVQNISTKIFYNVFTALLRMQCLFSWYSLHTTPDVLYYVRLNLHTSHLRTSQIWDLHHAIVQRSFLPFLHPWDGWGSGGLGWWPEGQSKGKWLGCRWNCRSGSLKQIARKWEMIEQGCVGIAGE